MAMGLNSIADIDVYSKSPVKPGDSYFSALGAPAFNQKQNLLYYLWRAARAHGGFLLSA